MIIRQETEADRSRVHDLVKTAFLTANVSDGDEQHYLDGLRKSSRFIPELSFVAEENGGLAGQVILTKTFIETEQGEVGSLLLGPVSVLYEHRCKGYGAALIAHALEKAKELGYTSVFLVGDPNYYGKLGFRETADYDITHKTIPKQFVLCKELTENALSEIKGTVNVV